jgi:hypothetical protein
MMLRRGLYRLTSFMAVPDHLCGLILTKFLLLDTPNGREECHVAVSR